MSKDAIVVSTSKDVNLDEFRQALEQAWEQASTDEEFVTRFGLDLPSPFGGAERGESQFDVATTILVPIAVTVGKDMAQTIWKEYLWPALKSQFGGRLQASEHVAAE